MTELRNRRALATLVLALLALAMAPPARASEADLQDEPAPESVEDLQGSLEEGFEERIRKRTLFPRLKEKLAQAPPFLRDTELVVHPRYYNLNRREEDDSRAEAWTLGGSLVYRSGWLADVFSIGAALYTSQKLSGKERRDGTGLLKPGQRSYTVAGQSYGRFQYRDNTLTLYRQELDLPYVNRNDSRMSPNTFEGAVLIGRWSKLDYGGGHLLQMKPRNADRFISLSEAAGVPGKSSQGLSMVGLRIRPWEGLSLGAIDYHVKDVINIAYTELDATHTFSEELGLRFQGQFTHQRSVGDERLTGSSFDTWVVGGRVATSYRSGILTAGFSSTDDGDKIRSPFGSYPGYLSLMQKDFNRAGEDAWLVGLSYVFGDFGLPELSFHSNLARGTGARDPETGADLPDQLEFDLTVDYKVEEGRLRGLWLRLRGSVVDVEGKSRNRNEVRAILNYEIPVL